MMKKRLNGSFIFVAEMDNKVVGFANFSPVNNEGQLELSAIYLYQSCHGKGIGTALLQRGIKELKNLQEVWIDVEKANTVGRAFYDSKGFQLIKEFEDHFDGHVLQTLRMCLVV